MLFLQIQTIDNTLIIVWNVKQNITSLPIGALKM